MQVPKGPAFFSKHLHMEGLGNSATHLKDHATEYVKTYIELAKVKATKGASNAAAGATIGIVAFILVFFFLQMVFIGLAWWVGGLVNSMAAGFFIVAGFLLLLLGLVFALRKKVIVPFIRNSIISKVYE